MAMQDSIGDEASPRHPTGVTGASHRLVSNSMSPNLEACCPSLRQNRLVSNSMSPYLEAYCPPLRQNRLVSNSMSPSLEAYCPHLRQNTETAYHHHPSYPSSQVGNLCPPIGEAQIGRPHHQDEIRKTRRVIRIHPRTETQLEKPDSTVCSSKALADLPSLKRQRTHAQRTLATWVETTTTNKTKERMWTT
jgi:hypothetical protein